MKTTRKGVFETNSSSTHSISIFDDSDFKKFQKGELFWDPNTDSLITKEETKEKIIKNLTTYDDYKLEDLEDLTIKELLELDVVKDNSYEYPQDYNSFSEPDYLEVDYASHTTKSGDKIIIFCKYGNNY